MNARFYKVAMYLNNNHEDLIARCQKSFDDVRDTIQITMNEIHNVIHQDKETIKNTFFLIKNWMLKD